MPHFRVLLLLPAAILLLALTPGAVPAQADLGGFGFPGRQASASALAEHPARASLVAEVDSVSPGRTFRVGVRVTLEPQWHIYWRNSGDSGLATTATLTLPAGFTAGPLQWPAPRRFRTESETTYGYAGEVVLFWAVTAPAAPGPGPFTFKAQASWLVCKVECIPGEAELELTLPAGEGAAAPEQGLIAAQAATLPAGPALAELRVEPARPRVAAGTPTTLTLTLPLEGLDAARLEAEPDRYGLYVAFPEDLEATHARGALVGTQWQISLPLQARGQAAGGARQLEAVLVRPTRETTLTASTLWLPLEIAPAPGAAPAATPQAAPAATPRGSGAPLDFVATAADASGQAGPLWLFLLYAFVGGLILNIMPCVLPVLSLKVLGFVKQAGESPARIRALGLLYAAGVVASFLLLAGAALALQAGGSEAAWGTQMQNPRFVMLLCAVVFAFALSLFGVFELEPPQAVNKLAGAAPREGLAGAFWSGVLTTALATPCSAPFLGPAMAFALAQPPALVVLFFVVVGLGLAAPYVVLAFRPGWLRWMPRPGPWMHTFKQLMGFVLMGTVVWLLFPLSGLLGPQALLWFCVFLLLLALACWLLGRGLDAMRGAGARRAHLLAALLLAVAGYVAFAERPLRASEAAPPQPAAAAQTGPAAEGGIAWEPFSPERVRALVDAQRTVFLDFTADWCVTCKVNEKGVLASAEVAELFRRHNVAAVRGDWTRRDNTIARVLKQFNRSGVPLYVVFPAGRAHEPIVLPTLLTTEMIANALERN